ncbi:MULTISPECIES: transporter substrate-binding domain-containing protein [unclassified Bradyrhizobium]|uniref:transporter substrate-binding domain-containing protein n=1 Tax=unclassified Bradyrhizobium TaxID=2631580 RepID=UPI0028E207C7|nr:MULTISPECIES: transporter substrate-binding domain-containing protein [unclassified Bradyrhizobium]
MQGKGVGIAKAFQSVVVVGALALASLSSVTTARGATTKDRILREKKLTAGVHDGKPWGYRTADGRIEGFNADIVKAVFEPLGVQVNFVTGDFGSLIPGLLSNRFDIVDSSVVITEERCKLVIFGDPELTSVDALLVLKGNPQKIASFKDVIANPALKIGGSRGSQQSKNAALAGVGGDQLQLFQNTGTTISALLAHRVDGITFTSGTANALKASPEISASVDRAKPFTGLTDANGKAVVSYVAAVFRPQDTDLRELFNKRLAELKADGTVAKIMARYGFDPDEKAPDGLTSTDVCAGKN